MLDYSKSFIEEQFPVAKISKESYKERKAGRAQTLTGLGKWWGRKPLIMVRSAILGALLPVSDDKQKDKDIFLKILTMDDEGIERRFKQNNPGLVYKIDKDASYEEKTYAYQYEDDDGRVKTTSCCRPEEINGPSKKAWEEINAHLETDAHNLQELVEQLGMKRYGHIPRVGDCFAGGGSNVFEPARLGCDVYGSDLNPLAGLLSKASLSILGSSEKELEELTKFQEKVFDETCLEIDKLDIEQNDDGYTAKYYLYCNEVKCPECGYKIPMLPSLIISKKENIVARLYEREDKCFDIHIRKIDSCKDVDRDATVKNSSLVCPHCGKITSIKAIRGGEDGGMLRKWGKEQFTPIDEDAFQERLYAIQYLKIKPKDKTISELRKKVIRTYSYFCEPSEQDILREEKVKNYIQNHFKEWSEKGYIPNKKIDFGEKTKELIVTRGWEHWHQLYNPRQLLILGILTEKIFEIAKTDKEYLIGILGINNIANRLSKLSIWDTSANKGAQTFSNQALNTLYNYACRTTLGIYNLWKFLIHPNKISCNSTIELIDARKIDKDCDIWITDPPYADAVNYHELSEYFLAWDKNLIEKAFPKWYTDSRRILAIKGTGEEFNKSMVDVYKNLANHMPDNGLQIVMFTHQDTKVWAELSMILWSAGLQVVSAWCIATETESGGLKNGNYVKGTVLMVLRKRISEKVTFEDDLYEEIRDAVQMQIDSMHDLDDVAHPDFTDGDYLLAAYVAALKVLTAYKEIAGLDVQYELEKARANSEDSPVTKLINTARQEAYDYLVPEGISSNIWSKLTPEERFYIKGLGMEMNGVHTLGAFQELARGFAVQEYADILGSTKSNHVRLKLPKEYKTKQIGDAGFGATLMRQILVAIYLSTEKDNVQEGCSYLQSCYADNNKYWALRTQIISILEFMCKLKGNDNVDYWQDTVEYVIMLKEAIRNDSM